MMNGTLVGRLGRDPETKDAGGHALTECAVAYDNGWGERKTTTWVRAKIWGKRGEKFAEHHSKGSSVVLHGTVYLDIWDKKDGTKGYTLCMDVRDWEFAGAKKERQEQPASQSGGYQQQSYGDNGGQLPDDSPF